VLEISGAVHPELNGSRLGRGEAGGALDLVGISSLEIRDSLLDSALRDPDFNELKIVSGTRRI